MPPEETNNPIDELIQALDENTIETNTILEHTLQQEVRNGQIQEQQLETSDRTHLEIKNGFEKVTKSLDDLAFKKIGVEIEIHETRD